MLTKNPAFLFDIFKYVKNDLFSLLGIYKYDYPVLFIAGLPKSGTTWVETQLLKIPGYNIRPIKDSDHCTIDHDICEAVFESLPGKGYSVLKLHTQYSAENLRVIRKYVQKFVIIIRDLRDMCISRYFHVKSEEAHRHYELYNNESLEAGMMHCIEIVDEAYVPWVRNWVEIAKENPDTILVVKYEDINQLTAATFKKIFDFFHLPDACLQEISKSKLHTGKNLKNELLKAGFSKSTARKGIVGDWKNYFSPAHKQKFKRIAGDLLIELDYEKNHDW